MNSKNYQKIVLKILSYYQENYYNKDFNFNSISNFCEKVLNLDDYIYLEILDDMKELSLIEGGFSIKSNIEGNYMISILAKRPRITPLGLEYVEDNKIFNKVLKNTASLMELASYLKLFP